MSNKKSDLCTQTEYEFFSNSSSESSPRNKDEIGRAHV